MQPHAALAAQLGLTEGAVKAAASRLLARYRECLKEEVAHTVASPGEVYEELRHLNLVYSSALRVVGEAHLAQDVAQMVFLDLARKAHSLPRGTALPGWLYRSAWFSAASVLRAARRREKRERKAMEMAAMDASGASVWEVLAPCLEEAMSQLDSGDQDALVLRFFDGCGLRDVGQALGLTEDAAQKLGFLGFFSLVSGRANGYPPSCGEQPDFQP